MNPQRFEPPEGFRTGGVRGTSRKPAKRGRRCKKCEKELSIHNKSRECFACQKSKTN